MDIGKLIQGQVRELLVDEEIIFNEDVKKVGLLDLSSVKVKGRITLPSDEDLFLEVTMQGEMVLADSVSLEPVVKPFFIEIAKNVYENNKKGENTLDIIPILWENIVLEVPIRYSKVEDYTNYQGDGWQLIGEEEIKRDNPFQQKNQEKEEE